jgi:WD40-like Beta Propeller Repeat
MQAYVASISSWRAMPATSGSYYPQLLEKNTPQVGPETGAFCYIPRKIQRQKVIYGCSHCRAIISRSRSCAQSSAKNSGQFSPDGHWVAYVSNESGRDEICVRDFSSGVAHGSRDAAGRWLISKSGGTSPRWRGDGKELFYVASDEKLMAVNISSKPVFQAGAPRPLFQLPTGFIFVNLRTSSSALLC